MRSISLTLTAMLVCTTAIAEYAGEGGMTKHHVTQEAYLYHYENGFTGADAVSWNPDLQYFWSRAGAAKTCGLAMNKEKIIDNLIKAYGDPSKIDDFMERFTHDMNGIQFHHLQSRKIDGFCNSNRVSEINLLIPKLEKGEFSEALQ